jgi:hypothetical protein
MKGGFTRIFMTRVGEKIFIPAGTIFITGGYLQSAGRRGLGELNI